MDSKVKNKLKQQERIMFFNITLLVFVGLIYYFLIMSGFARLDAMNQEINKELLNLTALEKKGQSVDGLKQSLGSAEAVVADIYKSFVKDEVVFVTTLEKMALQLGLEQQLNIGEAKIVGDFKKVAIDIRTQGEFKKQLALIESLKGSNYYFDIKSLELFPGTDERYGKDASSMHLKVDTYWYGNQK